MMEVKIMNYRKMYRFMDDERLGLADRVVYAYLYDRCVTKPKPDRRILYEWIAEDLKVDYQVVKRSVSRLVKLNLLTIQKTLRGNNFNVFKRDDNGRFVDSVEIKNDPIVEIKNDLNEPVIQVKNDLSVEIKNDPIVEIKNDLPIPQTFLTQNNTPQTNNNNATQKSSSLSLNTKLEPFESEPFKQFSPSQIGNMRGYGWVQRPSVSKVKLDERQKERVVKILGSSAIVEVESIMCQDMLDAPGLFDRVLDAVQSRRNRPGRIDNLIGYFRNCLDGIWKGGNYSQVVRAEIAAKAIESQEYELRRKLYEEIGNCRNLMQERRLHRRDKIAFAQYPTQEELDARVADLYKQIDDSHEREKVSA